MCCILGFLKWSVGCIHRTLTFFLGFWLLLVVLYACALAIGAGVAYGYDYCLAEYTALTRPNVDLVWQPREYKPERLVRRVGNVSGIMAEGDEFQMQWSDDLPLQAAVMKPLPQWLYKGHQVAPSNTSNLEKRETVKKVTNISDVTDTATNLSKAEVTFRPARYVELFPKPTSQRTTTRPTRTTEIKEKSKKATKMREVTDTATNLRRAKQRLLPAIYAKRFSKPTVHRVSSRTTRNTYKVKMNKKVTNIYEEISKVYNEVTDTTTNLRKAKVKFLPAIYVERFRKPTSERTATKTTRINKVKEKSKKATKMRDVTNIATNLRRAEQKLLPAIYAKWFSKPAIHGVSSSTTRNSGKVEMNKKVTEMYEETSEMYNEVTDTTTNLRTAELKLLPAIYSKWFFKPTVHRVSSSTTRNTNKVEMNEEVRRTEMYEEISEVFNDVTDKTTNLRKAEHKLLPAIYGKQISKSIVHRVSSSTTRNTDKVEMNGDVTEMYEETSEVYNDLTDTTTNLRRAEQKLFPAIYAKQISKPTVHRVLSSTTRNTDKVEINEEVTEMYEETNEVYNEVTDTTTKLRKAEQNLLPFIYAKQFSTPTLPPYLPFYLQQLSNHTSEKVKTNEEVTEMYKEVSKIYEEVTEKVANLSTETSSSTTTGHISKSPKPDVTTTMSTYSSSGSPLMRKILPKSNDDATWHPTRSDKFFYNTPEDYQRRKTVQDSYYPEMKIRVFDRPSYGKYERLPMRHWETMTRTSEPVASSEDIDYKKFIYF